MPSKPWRWAHSIWPWVTVEQLPDTTSRRPAGPGGWIREALVVEHVEEHDPGFRLQQRAVAAVDVVGAAREQEQVHEGDASRGLLREMDPDVPLVHRRDGVAAHDGMPVDAMRRAVQRGEQVPERAVAAEDGGADDERDGAAAEDAGADVDRAADGADGGRRVEGGADLVVA
jgi:hypothetical protein